jgi:hypothetical protein
MFAIEALILFAAAVMLMWIGVQKFRKNIEEPSFVEGFAVTAE